MRIGRIERVLLPLALCLWCAGCVTQPQPTPVDGPDQDGADSIMVSAGADPVTLAVGESATLWATVTRGTEPYTLTWSAEGWVGGSGDRVTVTPGDTTTYRLDVRDASDPPLLGTAEVTITVTDAEDSGEFTVSAEADPATITVGESAELQATVTGGTEPFALTWSAEDWEGATGDTVTVTPIETTVYQLDVVDASASPLAATAEVTVTVMPVEGPERILVTAGADPATITLGESATLWATVVGGTEPYTLTWSADEWEGPSGDAVTVSPTETTTYALDVLDASDPPWTATAEVAVVVTDADDPGGPGDSPAPRVVLETTLGQIIIELYEADAPIAVANFLAYVDEGFYDGGDELGSTIFHRVAVVPDPFVIQGGGYTLDLTQKETHDPITNEADNGRSNLRGTVAMARTSDPDSATSQFFINLVDNEFLDYSETSAGYAVFGAVAEGMDVVDAIAAVETMAVPPLTDVPVTPVVITSAQPETK